MFFSGFSLQGEEGLFAPWLISNEWSVAGFSLGAIDAFEYALSTDKRVELLQLFSPAFFHDKSESFKRVQMREFCKDEQKYSEAFLANISFPSSCEMKNFFHQGSWHDLEKLLHYTWDENKMSALVEKGVALEVYLGGEDKIINAKEALDFFSQFGRVEYYKSFGHILKGKE